MAEKQPTTKEPTKKEPATIRPATNGYNLRSLRATDLMLGRVERFFAWEMPAEEGREAIKGINMYFYGGLVISCGDIPKEELPKEGQFIGVKIQQLKNSKFQLTSWRYMYVSNDGKNQQKLTNDMQLLPAEVGHDFDTAKVEEMDGDW